MQFHNTTAEIFVPDGTAEDEALQCTTYLGISAHQDDIEIMAFHGVLHCFGSEDDWFGGVVVTNGAGSPRDGLYADYSDGQMQARRRNEQKKAACVGEYSFQALLDYESSAIKDPSGRDAVEDLKAIMNATMPEVVYTHNLADRHDTHVATALKVIAALRELPAEQQPKKLYGCEVWRDLDWLTDDDKIPLDVDGHENLAAALLGVFDSQISGGKRYDLATLGRRRAHATYYASHGVDTATQLNFAMDMTPLIADPSLDPGAFVATYIDRFAEEVSSRIDRLK